MDFLDPKKKRAHTTRLFVGYALLTAIISLVALLLVFQAYGYNFNLQTGNITQNGLVFVDAHPQPANVFLNGQQKGTTDKRLIMPADNYKLELKRDGYRTWQREFTLLGGTIERLVYPFLFPEKLEPKEVQLFAAEPAFASQSLDRRWLVTSQPGSPLALSLIDLDSDLMNPAPLSLPQSLFSVTGTNHKIELIEWAADNRNMMVKHTFDAGVEFVLVDHQTPANSVNLSATFTGTAFTNISLRDKKFDRYYLHDLPSQTLKTAELQGAIVAPLLEKVLQFKPHGADMLIYITSEGAKEGHVSAKIRDGGQDYTLRELPEDVLYLLDIARFNDRWYIVVGAATDKRVYVLRNPIDFLRRNPPAKLVPASIMRVDNPEFVSFSTNARFVAVQSGSQLNVYDAETDRNYRYDTKLELVPAQKATWMDGHRLTLTSGEKVEVFDFDGTNRQTLVSSYKSLTPYFKGDYTALYTLAPSPNVTGRTGLLRTGLLVQAQE